MTAQDDALAVARFCWPEHEWISRPYGARVARGEYRTFEPTRSYDDIAAAEAVLVERGLGYVYGLRLLEELGIDDARWPEEAAAQIRTAPLDVCLRAMAAVVRKQQEAKR